MIYYKVKPEYDNFRLYHKGEYMGFLIKNELLTEEEMKGNKIPSCRKIKLDMFEKIDVPEDETYYFFGARFAD